MNINLENYEAFVLDYFEGRLNKAEREALVQFILLHPELNLDLDAELPAIENDDFVFKSKENLKREYTPAEEELLEYLENTMLPSDKASFEQKLKQDPLLASELNAFQKTILTGETGFVFEFKDQLQKHEDDLYLNNKALQYLEGEFNHEEALAFENELALNSGLSTELGMYRKTIFSADTSIVFENKALLKKKTLILPLFKARVVYSAAAAIALIVLFGFVLNTFLNPSELPQNTPSVAAISPANKVPKTSDTKQPLLSSKKYAAKTQVHIVRNENKNQVTASTDPSLAVTNEVLAQNQSSVDATATSTLNSLNTPSLALENNAKPASQADKESLEKLEYAYMIPFEEDEEEESASENSKKTNRGFWSFATRMAKKANQIGIKSVNGSEDENNNYLLSFNAMTIEKK